MNDPWAFGWTPLLTIVGFVITVGIATFGFRTFERWRREKIEEKKLDIALEAMALAHESKYVFETIRSPMSFPWEWKDMPRSPGESDEAAHNREPYFAILARIDRSKDFFERLFKLQPRFMALFGADSEAIFMKIHTARRTIEVSASMLMKTINSDEERTENRRRQHDQWECDIWDGMDQAYAADLPHATRVADQIRSFRDDVVALCEPVVTRKESAGAGRLFSWNP
jgi:hypothetical protein